MIRLIRCMVLALILIPATSSAQDFDVGMTAYKADDFATALREWTPLAEQGNADAQFELGSMYLEGQGVERNESEAVNFYRLSAEQGNARAQLRLGFIYGKAATTLESVLEFQVVPQDFEESLMWYRRAAEQGQCGGANYPRRQIRIWRWREAGQCRSREMVPSGG